MIRYHFTIAVLVIHSHLTNAGEIFNEDVNIIEDHLREEVEPGVGEIIGEDGSSKERADILCDELDKFEKQSICDKIMQILAKKYYRYEFLSFLDTPPYLSLPPIVTSKDPYTCEERSIEKLNMKKPMFWCGSQLFRKRKVYGCGEIEGFFCAGSRKTDGRVFAFSPPAEDSQEVRPFGELDNVVEILQYVHGSDSDSVGKPRLKNLDTIYTRH